MAKILQQDAPVLRAEAEPVNPKDFGSPRLKKILQDMRVALEKEEDGVAIAAPQIGVPLRIFIVSHRVFEMDEEPLQNTHQTEPSPPKEKKRAHDIVFINPSLLKVSRKKKWVPEGCLSVRWLYGEVARADKATVRAYDENGKLFTRGAGGLLAQIFQHETDHLNGVLFIDTARNVEKVTKEEIERQKHHHHHA
jgi:peptide deformylase